MMSVLKCSRNRCEHIMCSRLSSNHGYICSDCYDELVLFCIDAKSVDNSTIESFMALPKQTNKIDWEGSIREALDNEFRRAKA